MAKRDYYEVLGINKNASADQIKSAYRKLAVKYHPDKNKGDKASEEKFKEASEAYHVLSNDERKQIMTILGMQLLKMVEAEEDLEILISRAVSQIFLKTFLGKVSAVAEDLENRTIEDRISDTICL